MPLYPLECHDEACGDRTEALLSIREYESGEWPTCPTCGGAMRRIYLAAGQRAQRFDPIVIHEGPGGEYSFPMHASAPVPEGFLKREIRSFAEADQVMRRVNATERIKAAQHVEERGAQLEYMESVNRSDLRQRMQSMSPAGRAFAEFAMKLNDAKRRPRSVDPNVMIECREYDASNRERHRDALTEWKGRRM